MKRTGTGSFQGTLQTFRIHFKCSSKLATGSVGRNLRILELERMVKVLYFVLSPNIEGYLPMGCHPFSSCRLKVESRSQLQKVAIHFGDGLTGKQKKLSKNVCLRKNIYIHTYMF